MSTPLLTTKLHIPPVRPGLVSRSRLLERLDESLSLGCKLTLVSAPAGFGKTTLLSGWANGRGGEGEAVAWLALDEGDNDPARFLAYLVAALQRVRADLGQAVLAALQAPHPPPIEALLTVLINESAASSDHLVLVLDDLHVISNQQVNAALAFLLDNLPPQIHLILASRADPPWPLARLRARRAMTELRASDLRFTAQEAAAFLNDATRLNLAAQDVAALEKRTEGWIAGLQMAALSMRGQEDAPGFIRAFGGSHRFVLDYLVEEVLERQPRAIQDFLFQTCFLERMSGALCDAVTGGQDSQTTLAHLERANLFLVPLDHERRWYRYHRLFADLLRARAAQDAAWIERQRRAAAWHQAQGYDEDAFEYWVRAGAFDEAAALVEAQALGRLNQGQTTLVRAWVERLPPELVASRPWLLVFRAWSLLLTGEMTAVPTCLAHAEQVADAAAVPEVAGHIAAMRAYAAALQGQVPAAVALAQQALGQLRPDDLAIRSVVSFVLGGMRLLLGNPRAAQAAFVAAAQAGQAAHNQHVAVPAWCSVAYLQLEQGQLRQAEATYRQALDLATTPGKKPLPLAAQPYNGLARLAYERNDLPAASAGLDASLRLSRQWQNPETTVYGLLAQANLHRAQGNLDEALGAWQEAASVAQANALNPLAASRLAAARQELWLAAGSVAEAARAAAERGVTANDALSYARQAEHVALARILLAQGRAGEALALLARLVAAAQDAGRNGCLVELLALQALAYQAQGQAERAWQALERALALAEPQGYVRVFLDQGLPMAQLLTELRAKGGQAAAYAAKLLAAWPDSRGEASPQPPMLEPLSERELQVLRLLAAGAGNQAIAAELVVAMGTVKAHTSAIYRKLDVRSRTQAVARARELGLIA